MTLQREINKLKHKLRTLVLDMKHYGPDDTQSRGLTAQRLGQLTQLNRGISLEADREAELATYFELSAEAVGELKAIGRERLKSHFTEVSTDTRLFSAYREARLDYCARMMLGYTRLEKAKALLKILNAYYPPHQRPSIRVLDYGCGVADYGLAFALFGYAVTLCDIEGGNLDFAAWRFGQRNLPCSLLPVSESNPNPDLEQHHIILAGELLEHLRNPLQAVQNGLKALPPGGFFWTSGYPFVEKEVGGDHLPEAAEQRQAVLDLLLAEGELIADPYKELGPGLVRKRMRVTAA